MCECVFPPSHGIVIPISQCNLAVTDSRKLLSTGQGHHWMGSMGSLGVAQRLIQLLIGLGEEKLAAVHLMLDIFTAVC